MSQGHSSVCEGGQDWSLWPSATGTFISVGNLQSVEVGEELTASYVWLNRPFPFQRFYTSSPPYLYRYAWGVQPAKREEDWGRGLLGFVVVAIRCA